MKILHVIPAFYPAQAYGGTVEVSYQLCKELARKGHNVTVYTSDTLDKYHRQKSNFSIVDGVHVNYFKGFSNSLAWNHRIIFTPGIVFKLRKEIKKFDVIHLHGFRNFLNIATYYYAKKYDIPYVIHGHGDLPYVKQKVLIKQIFDQVVGLQLLRNASKCIALNQTEEEEFEKLGANTENIIILPNGINLTEYADLPKIGDFKKKYGINENCKIILYLGRLNRTKGIDLLVNAFADIHNEIDQTLLCIIGPDDGYKSEIINLAYSLGISDFVFFPGFVKNNEKISAFVDAEVFVTPTFYGFPVTFVEACVCGTPIVTTTQGDRLDWIDGNVGFVVPHNKNELKNAILKIISCNDSNEIFKKDGFKIIIKEFNWNVIGKKCENLYSNIITTNND